MAKRRQLKTIDDLRPAPYNPRKISDAAAKGLGASMERFGDLSGLVWNQRTGHLVAGHQRLAALRKRGAVFSGGAVVVGGESFPVRVVDLSPTDEQAANLAANNPAIAGEFTDGVAGILAEVKAADAALFESLRLGELLVDLPAPTGPIDLGAGTIDEKPDMVRASVFVPAAQAKTVMADIHRIVEGAGGVVVEDRRA
ncbi:MAG: ParB N-terminal domain-containing protein [Verrucomicrobiota bacterium]